MNKYSEIYQKTLNDKLGFSLVPSSSALSESIKPVAGRVIEAARPALMQGAKSIQSAARPMISKAVTALGGIGASGLAAQQVLGGGTTLGKARDFAYNLAGKDSPTITAGNKVMDMELARLNQRKELIQAGLPVSGASARDGSLMGNMPKESVPLLGGSAVDKSQKQLDTQLNANRMSAVGETPGFVPPAKGMSPKMQTTNGMVETRPAQAVLAPLASQQKSVGPDDAFLKKVMGSYNSKSSLDQRKADAIRKVYKPGMTANQIYADKGYIAASRRK